MWPYTLDVVLGVEPSQAAVSALETEQRPRMMLLDVIGRAELWLSDHPKDAPREEQVDCPNLA